jgi:LPXTG-site transpeptidase (sortase) family protein
MTHTKRTLIALLVVLLALASVPAAHATEEGTISIPSLSINSNVVTVYLAILPEGVTWDVGSLGWNVGHLDGTATFGQPGNTVLAGHSELSNRRAGVFSQLGGTQVGAEIVIGSNGTEFRYIVTAVQVVGIYDLSVISPTSDERLTIITCDPSSYNRITRSYERRIAVIAQRVS